MIKPVKVVTIGDIKGIGIELLINIWKSKNNVQSRSTLR